MALILALLLTVYLVGVCWTSNKMLVDLLHESHQHERFGLGRRPEWWAWPLCSFAALLWPFFLGLMLFLDCFDELWRS